MQCLAYSYPGNVRELMNICERLVVMSESPRIDIDDLPSAITSDFATQIAGNIGDVGDGRTLPQIMSAVEQRILKLAMKKYRTQAKAAHALGINQSTIARKLNRAGSVSQRKKNATFALNYAVFHRKH